MSNVHVIRVPPTLTRGRVCRLVETPDGFLLVQVWSDGSWRAEPTASISPSDVRDGIDPTPRILRALGVPASDWPVILIGAFVALLMLFEQDIALIPVGLAFVL